MALLDLDEFIYPTGNETLLSYLRSVDGRRNMCAVEFTPQIFMRDEFDPPLSEVEPVDVDMHLAYTTAINGSVPTRQFMGKAVVKPHHVIGMFVHHYTAKVGNCSGSYSARPKEAYFRHYHQTVNWGSYQKALEWGRPFADDPPHDSIATLLVERVAATVRNLKASMSPATKPYD